MKVCGFSFIRNAITYDYPIVEALRSILPYCDAVILAVGESDDKTKELVESIDPKIKIINTIWDDNLREGGAVLAAETNKAFQAIPDEYDWAFYIQGDEVLHEENGQKITEAMSAFANDKTVDGLLFQYRHFYGSYDYIGDASNWYRKEIRIIKNNKSFYSYRDAQGFRKGDNQKLRVKELDAYIHHYGWVKDPSKMQKKQENFHRLWHDDQWVEKNVVASKSFDYSQINSLKKYTGKHPDAIKHRISLKNWKFDHDISTNRYSFKEKMKRIVEKITGHRPGEYKNYRILP